LSGGREKKDPGGTGKGKKGTSTYLQSSFRRKRRGKKGGGKFLSLLTITLNGGTGQREVSPGRGKKEERGTDVFLLHSNPSLKVKRGGGGSGGRKIPLSYPFSFTPAQKERGRRRGGRWE